MKRNLAASLWLVMLSGCGGPQGSPVPDEMQGHWQAILTYVPAFWAGAVPNADFNGSLGVFFDFSPDGDYQFSLNTMLSYFGGNCFRTTRWHEVGTVSIEGSSFTFTAAEATNVVTDSCGESSATQADPGEPVTLKLTPDRDPAGGAAVRLGLPNGEALLLERNKD